MGYKKLNTEYGAKAYLMDDGGAVDGIDRVLRCYGSGLNKSPFHRIVRYLFFNTTEPFHHEYGVVNLCLEIVRSI